MEPENQNEHHENEGAPAEGQASEEAQSPFTPNSQEDVAPLQKKASSLGPIVGIIIIVILIVLAGFYFWGSSLQQNVDTPVDDTSAVAEEVANETNGIANETDSAASAEEDAPVEVGEPLSESDEIEDLEAELSDTDLENLDAELEAIDEELTF